MFDASFALQLGCMRWSGHRSRGWWKGRSDRFSQSCACREVSLKTSLTLAKHCLHNQVYGRNGSTFDEKALMGHHFFVIRAIAGNERETSDAIQDRLTTEFFETIEEYDA